MTLNLETSRDVSTILLPTGALEAGGWELPAVLARLAVEKWRETLTTDTTKHRG